MPAGLGAGDRVRRPQKSGFQSAPKRPFSRPGSPRRGGRKPGRAGTGSLPHSPGALKKEPRTKCGRPGRDGREGLGRPVVPLAGSGGERWQQASRGPVTPGDVKQHWPAGSIPPPPGRRLRPQRSKPGGTSWYWHPARSMAANRLLLMPTNLCHPISPEQSQSRNRSIQIMRLSALIARGGNFVFLLRLSDRRRSPGERRHRLAIWGTQKMNSVRHPPLVVPWRVRFFCAQIVG